MATDASPPTEEIQHHRALLESPSQIEVLEGTRFFSLLLQVKGDLQSIARTIAAAGCLPLLVRIIGSDSSTGDARNQAVLCLHTIVKKGCCVLTPEIIDIDMISVLQRVGTLEFVLSGASATANLAETALRTLGYIARAGPQLRDAVVAAGAAESVTALLLQADEVSEHPHGGVPSAVLFTALHAAKKMIGVKPTPPIAGVYEQLVRAAARHLELCNATPEDSSAAANTRYSRALANVFWTMYYASLDDRGVDVLVDCLDVRAVVCAMGQTGVVDIPKLATSLLNCFAGGSESMTQVVVDADGVSALFLAAMHSDKQEVRKEAAMALSNVAAGTPEQSRAVILNPHFATLSRQFSDLDRKLQQEYVWIIGNASRMLDPCVIDTIVACDAFAAIAACLRHEDFVEAAQIVVLETLEYILKAPTAGGDVNYGRLPDFVVSKRGLDMLGEFISAPHAAKPAAARASRLLAELCSMAGVGEECHEFAPSSGSSSDES